MACVDEWSVVKRKSHVSRVGTIIDSFGPVEHCAYLVPLNGGGICPGGHLVCVAGWAIVELTVGGIAVVYLSSVPGEMFNLEVIPEVVPQNPAREQHSFEAQVPSTGPHCPLVLVPGVAPPVEAFAAAEQVP